MEKSPPSNYAQAVGWAADNKELLLRKWKDLNERD
jgi:hypothetical protein